MKKTSAKHRWIIIAFGLAVISSFLLFYLHRGKLITVDLRNYGSTIEVTKRQLIRVNLNFIGGYCYDKTEYDPVIIKEAGHSYRPPKPLRDTAGNYVAGTSGVDSFGFYPIASGKTRIKIFTKLCGSDDSPEVFFDLHIIVK